MSRKGAGSTTPLSKIRILPACSTTKIRPLPSPAWVTWTGDAKPPATTAREICGNGPGGGAVTVRVTGMLIGEPVAPAEVIVTDPLYVPAASPEMSTLTVTVDGAAPLAGVAECQVALPDAAQESVPPPAFVTDIVWEAGLAPPAWPVNARLPGVTDNTGEAPGGLVTVRVTGMFIGEPVAPAEVIVTDPLYVPAASPEMSTLTVTVDGAAPLAGVAECQVALPVAAQESVPPPAFVTDIAWEAGLALPAWPVNARLPGVTDNTGEGPGAGPGPGAGVEVEEEPPPHPARNRNARMAIGFRNPARRRSSPACLEKSAPHPIGPPAPETRNRIPCPPCNASAPPAHGMTTGLGPFPRSSGNPAPQGGEGTEPGGRVSERRRSRRNQTTVAGGILSNGIGHLPKRAGSTPGVVVSKPASPPGVAAHSGGTDLCTAFVGGVPLLPVHRGELQARALGAAVEAWDEEGNAVIDQVGELVVTEPMPSMPVFLWGDEDGSRYRASYFEHYPGVWRHGDWIEITSRGTAIIYGRSDSTINRQGVRMGTSEIYRAVLDVEEIVDALVVDIPRPGTEGWMPLFVVLREGATLDEGLRKEIARRVRERCSPRHVPDEVFQIDAVPRTLSGKALEVPVKRILMGTPAEQAASRDSLANPAALDWFVELAGTLEA